MKKLLVVTILMLFICASVIQSTGTIMENKSIFIKEFKAVPCYLDVELFKTVTMEKFSNRHPSHGESIIIHDNGTHPTVSGDKNGRFFAGFEVDIEGDYYPDFWYSLDDGMTWDEAGYFSESSGAEYTDVDLNDNGFYGTFGAPIDFTGQQWVIIAEDLPTITGQVWDWGQRGIDDLKHMSISCYTREDELWNYGGIVGTGYNGYQGNDTEGCPFIFYPVSDTTGAIDWLDGLEDYYHSDIAIDEETELSYAVYDHTSNANLFVRKDNFGEREGSGRHPFIDSWFIGDNVTLLRNPSIEAHDDTVVLVCEEEGNIVCFYSNDGFETVNKSTVVISAQYPDVKVTFGGSLFACSYVKDNTVFSKISEDGGATWTYENQVSESQTSGGYSSHDLGKGDLGMYAVWEEGGIYFGDIFSPHFPVPVITSIKGPIGVTATIKNIGTDEATNVEWTIKITGGIFNLINKVTNGTQAILKVGEEFRAKSDIVIGLGKISIFATVTCDEGLSDEKDASGKQIFIFTLT